jgi:hypothetical protein
MGLPQTLQIKAVDWLETDNFYTHKSHLDVLSFI